MPLFSQYRKQLKSQVADINNSGQKERSAGACTAARFLKEFVNIDKWAHFDIAGVLQAQDETSYLGSGMSGEKMQIVCMYNCNCILMSIPSYMYPFGN